MLNPDHGQLYSDALRPPPGFRFTSAVATTYSLDLETLLTFPLHLALFSSEQPKEELLRDAIGLLEALRRTSSGITIFAHAGRIIAPRHPHPLFGLLESVVVEVLPPDPSGAFHPKLWLIRFDDPESSDIALRLLVLTRNLTEDRSWDLVLSLDGAPTRRHHSANRPLSDLIAALPGMALHPLPEARVAQILELAGLVRTAEWELPANFTDLRFHVAGLRRGQRWLPEDSAELAVISPFLSGPALSALIASSRRPIALVSRPEELAALDPLVLRSFERVLVLSDRAERQDGEEESSPARPGELSHGLHAKAYVAKHGWDTRYYVGSANATSPALLNGANVELMAELTARRSRVGSVEDVISSEGLGPILRDYSEADAPAPPDPVTCKAEAELDQLRGEIARCGLTLRFELREEGWVPTLSAKLPFTISNGMAISGWPVTRPSEIAVDLQGIAGGGSLELPPCSAAVVTSFVAIELRSLLQPVAVRFVLAAEAENLPEDARDAAVLRAVVQNRAGFVRYVLMLLAELEAEEAGSGLGLGSWKRFCGSHQVADDQPLFEMLTRAFCREPERLESIRRLIEQLERGSRGDGDSPLVPEDFLELWRIFAPAGLLEEGAE